MTKKILYSSPEAASIKTVTGWVSSNGRFWGHDENMARYDGSTHKLCKCGAEVDKKSYCEPCTLKDLRARIDAMPTQEWNGKDWVYSHATDLYFNDPGEIIDYCENEGRSEFDLELVLCNPTFPISIDLTELWHDELPEDADESYIPDAILEALAVLNKAIEENAEPLSYYPGEFAVSKESLAKHFATEPTQCPLQSK